MLNKVTKTLMAGAVAFTAATAPVMADDADDVFIGAIVLGILGLALNNSDGEIRARTNTGQRPREITPLSQGNQIGTRNARRGLPAACLQRFETRRGAVRVFDDACLQRSYRAYWQLPRGCEVSVRTRRGIENGFDPRCLRDAGYRLAGR